MLEKKIYLDHTIGRKKLVSELHTNETYISCAIREAVGMTVNEYINFYRLKYAEDLLISRQQELTIEDIAMNSGFSSTRHFYRLFKKKHGITPIEFCKKQNTPYLVSPSKLTLFF